MNLKETLAIYGINSIWHFTDRSNLESILEHGIFSLKKIISEDIYVPCFGANELSHNLDRRYGLDKYVHLSLIQEHPMQYVKTRDGHIPDPVWLEIDAKALFRDNVVFSDEVANSKNSNIYDINRLESIVDLEVLWGRTDWRNPNIQQRRRLAKKGEIMIPNNIKITDIKDIKNG